MPSRSRAAAALTLLLAAAGVSFVLVLHHHGLGRGVTDAVCGVGPGAGCDLVNQSAYSTLLGVPIAALGLVFSLTLVLLLALGLLAGDEARAAAARVAFLALVGALAVDAGLLVLQAVAIKAYCALCLSTYLLNAGALAALWPARQATGPLWPARGTEVRLVVAGGLLGGVAAASVVLAAQLALGGRTASLASLGAGAPAASGDLGAARAEAQRLQAILDDPKKLEEYFTAKAAREFDQEPVQNLDLAGVPSKGPESAPIRVVEYSDFLCPFCQRLAGAMAAYLPQTATRVALSFKNYPLDKQCNTRLQQTVHEGACWLALGALCAQQQGRFWEYHDRVFGHQGELHAPGRPEVVRLAGQAGLDTGKLDACIDQPETRDRLTAQIEEAMRAGVKGTPTLFINGKRLPRLNDFVAMIDKEALRLGLPPLPVQGR